jgi:hypothetical protein|tara:strand:- start:86 stop:490 length:405 start_codon:yes stop_codon:yes gene_type:complete
MASCVATPTHNRLKFDFERRQQQIDLSGQSTKNLIYKFHTLYLAWEKRDRCDGGSLSIYDNRLCYESRLGQWVNIPKNAIKSIHNTSLDFGEDFFTIILKPKSQWGVNEESIQIALTSADETAVAKAIKQWLNE